jgi:hypothetical protein
MRSRWLFGGPLKQLQYRNRAPSAVETPVTPAHLDWPPRLGE